MLIRLPEIESAHEGTALAQTAGRALAALRQAALPAVELTGSEVVGPAIGEAQRQKGVAATLASIVGITAYIALRFRPSFAAGAIAATFHDIGASMQSRGHF